MELLISERMDFSEKSAAFIQILKKQCKNQKTFEKKARNDFAHKLYLTPRKEDLGKHQIILRQFKNKKTDVYYTSEEIEKILTRINKYSVMIKERNADKWG
jgi:hypothetical protein